MLFWRTGRILSSSAVSRALYTLVPLTGANLILLKESENATNRLGGSRGGFLLQHTTSGKRCELPCGHAAFS